MKRGKDDEKGMGPMFPRLHVNDTEKGGPRAPPRNKMALYEQLTIPSQRYPSAAVPPNLSNTASTIQGTRPERNMYFPVYQPPLATCYEERQARQPEGVSSSNRLEQVDGQRKSPEEEEFTVPIFSQPGLDRKTQNSMDGGRHAHPRQHVMNQDGRNLGVFHAYSDTSAREKVGGRWRQDAKDQPLESTHEDISLSLNLNHGTGFANRDATVCDDGAQRVVNRRSRDTENVGRGDDVSETSVVDRASGVDVTPDDVVGVLGRKHFWKARTAIVNQQRVFAVQVFELHRLIKVQKLLAGSPHLLLEASAPVNTASLNRTSMKQHSSDYTHIKHKDDSQKPTDKLEGTAENAVAKAPIPPSRQNTIQSSVYQPFPVPSPGPTPALNTTDPKVNPSWGGFPQPTGHQWLVPVMSPSEGLVYKPYPGPGFMGGGYPLPYGASTPHPHQGTEGMPFGGQGYFFPYGMPMVSPAGSASAVDQTNLFNPYGQTGNTQQQGSCNMPPQKNVPSAFRTPPPKEPERQGSSASSPCERAQEVRELDALPLFPTAPTTETPKVTPPTENQSTRVIRVVPRNPVSSRESAARIFQSIQEERQRYDP